MKLIVEKDDIYAGLLLTDCYDNLNIVAELDSFHRKGHERLFALFRIRQGFIVSAFMNAEDMAKFVNEYQSGRGMKSFSTNTLTIKDKS